MPTNYIKLLLMLTFAAPANSVFSFGPCPSVFNDPEKIISFKDSSFLFSQAAFTPSEYLGLWFVIFKTSDFPFILGNCTQALYYISQSKKIFAFNSEIVNGFNSSASAEVFIDPNIQGQLYFKFSHFSPTTDLKIIHTDYENTALIFSCTSIFIAHWKYAWILSRSQNPVIPEVYFELINDLGIPKHKLSEIPQEKC